MYLQHIQLTNYRSHAAAAFGFSHRITAFTGRNGSGKTNLLDAIGYLSSLRSFLSHVDQNHVHRGADFFSIRGLFYKNQTRYEITCSFRITEGKRVLENGNPYARLSAHIGKYPMVLIAPHDGELVAGGSEVRRKFFDQVISQTDPAYLNDLVAYQQTLQQRNALLSRFFNSRTWDEDWIALYDEKLAETGTRIVMRRQHFMQTFRPAMAAAYAQLAGEESVELDYHSQLSEQNLLDLLKNTRQQDRHLQRTTAGPHRDDYYFGLNKSELKKTGSQGQQKSFIAALKLAQYRFVEQETGITPILLLDDLFDKLDDLRVNRLLQIIARSGNGQVFITDAREDRTRQALSAAGLDFEIMPIE